VPRISRRVAAIAESATLAIDAKAKALKAAGEDVIGFGAGEPDFPSPRHVVQAAAAASHQPRFHRYTPTAGLPELRAAVAAKTMRDSGLRVEANQVLVTNGGKQALFQAFATLLDPGDEVLLPAPYWVTYPEAIALAGGVPVVVPTDAASGFRAGVEQLEAAATSRTKLLVFVSPSNPTGAVYPREELEAVGRWAAERGLWVVTDEIYEHLVYGDARFHSLPVVVPELGDRCVVVNGVAKTYAMTGWRVGWLVGPPDVVGGATTRRPPPTSSPTRPPTSATSRRRPPWRPSRATCRRWPRCGPPSTGGGGASSSCSGRSPASPAWSRRAPSTRSRRWRACSAASCAAACR
jgi:aspartate aminotransferase